MALRYRPRSEAGTAEELAAELAERREADLARGFTTHGPHLDEVVIERAGRALRRYGSQGEQRLALLALLFAEREALVDAGRSAPMMLLDDVTSELDPERRALLVRAAARGRRPGADHRDRGRAAARPSARARSWRCARDGVIAEAVDRGRGGGPASRPQRRAPRRLGDALGAVRAETRAGDPARGGPGRVAAIAGAAIAAEAEPVAERDGVVTVACRSATWAQELDLLGPDLLGGLNTALEDGRFGPGGAAALHRRRRPPRPLSTATQFHLVRDLQVFRVAPRGFRPGSAAILM